MSRLMSGRTWGVLTGSVPVSNADLTSAIQEEQAQEASNFVLIDGSAGTTTSTVKKVARSIVFKITVIGLYEETC